MHRAITAMVLTGLAPSTEIRETWLPVDRAAAALVETSLTMASGNFVHTSAECFSLQECLHCAQELGIDIRILPHAEWERAIVRKTTPESEFAIAAVRPRNRDDPRDEDEFQPIVVPGVDRVLLKTWLRRVQADV
jgi:hypothetical protein